MSNCKHSGGLIDGHCFECQTQVVPEIPPVIRIGARSTDGLHMVIPGHEAPAFIDGNGKDEGPTKSSNPKDVVGSRKLSLSCVPWTLIVCAARALWEGVLKYGRFNWRICGIRGSIYLDALKRHLAKYENGQDVDPKTKIHHLDSMIGCLAIMRDAMLYGKFEDDRPPCPDPDAMARIIDEGEAFNAQLRETFKDFKPYQFSIKDTPRQEI